MGWTGAHTAAAMRHVAVVVGYRSPALNWQIWALRDADALPGLLGKGCDLPGGVEEE
jgi:hypothetical protein